MTFDHRLSRTANFYSVISCCNLSSPSRICLCKSCWTARELSCQFDFQRQGSSGWIRSVFVHFEHKSFSSISIRNSFSIRNCFPKKHIKLVFYYKNTSWECESVRGHTIYIGVSCTCEMNFFPAVNPTFYRYISFKVKQRSIIAATRVDSVA